MGKPATSTSRKDGAGSRKREGLKVKQAMVTANEHALPASRPLAINSEGFTYNSVHAPQPGDILLFLPSRSSER